MNVGDYFDDDFGDDYHQIVYGDDDENQDDEELEEGDDMRSHHGCGRFSALGKRRRSANNRYAEGEGSESRSFHVLGSEEVADKTDTNARIDEVVNYARRIFQPKTKRPSFSDPLLPPSPSIPRSPASPAYSPDLRRQSPGRLHHGSAASQAPTNIQQPRAYLPQTTQHKAKTPGGPVPVLPTVDMELLRAYEFSAKQGNLSTKKKSPARQRHRVTQHQPPPSARSNSPAVPAVTPDPTRSQLGALLSSKAKTDRARSIYVTQPHQPSRFRQPNITSTPTNQPTNQPITEPTTIYPKTNTSLQPPQRQDIDDDIASADEDDFHPPPVDPGNNGNFHFSTPFTLMTTPTPTLEPSQHHQHQHQQQQHQQHMITPAVNTTSHKVNSPGGSDNSLSIMLARHQPREPATTYQRSRLASGSLPQSQHHIGPFTLQLKRARETNASIAAMNKPCMTVIIESSSQEHHAVMVRGRRTLCPQPPTTFGLQGVPIAMASGMAMDDDTNVQSNVCVCLAAHLLPCSISDLKPGREITFYEPIRYLEACPVPTFWTYGKPYLRPAAA